MVLKIAKNGYWMIEWIDKDDMKRLKKYEFIELKLWKERESIRSRDDFRLIY